MRTVVRIASLALIFSLFPAIPGASAQPPQAPTERLVVVLEEGFSPRRVAEQAIERTGGRVEFIYQHAISGFSVVAPGNSAVRLARIPGVAFIEPDVRVEVAAQTESTGYDRVDADLNPSGANYSSIDIAVIDTGIWYDTAANLSHEDLNLTWVTDCTSAIYYPLFGGCSAGGVDGNGHGTHVAGIAAACDNSIGTRGIAPCATLWSFKALGDDGSGYLGSVLAAVDLVTANADKIEVANMSLTMAGESQALTTAVDAAVAEGVAFVVAAGNSGADASLYSPASIESAITVSSVTDYDGQPGSLSAPTCYPDVDDMLATYSNFGAKVDIAAPGTCINSTYLNNGYATFSGTSMASPAVAGAVARYFHDNGIDPTSAGDVIAVRNALVNGGMSQSGPCGFGGDTDGFAEPLLYMNGPAFGGTGDCGAGSPPPNQPPQAVISSASCTDLTCSFDASGSHDDSGIDIYHWDFGDGQTGSGVSVSHGYAVAGSYTVTLTVTDTEGLEGSATTIVEPADPAGPIVMTTAVPGFEHDGRWATTQFFVMDVSFAFVPGAEVTGEWTYLDRRGRVRTKGVTAVSDDNGLVTIRTRFRHTSPTQFCVLDITKPGYVYVESTPCGGPV